MSTPRPRPIIGINLDFELEPNARSLLRETYYDAVHRAGGCPLLIPPIVDPEHIAGPRVWWGKEGGDGDRGRLVDPGHPELLPLERLPQARREGRPGRARGRRRARDAAPRGRRGGPRRRRRPPPLRSAGSSGVLGPV